MKKVGIGIIIAILIIAIGGGTYFMLNSNKEEKSDNLNQNMLSSNNDRDTENKNMAVVEENNNDIDNEKKEETKNSNNQSKTLVVFFSAQSHTKAVAEKIADKLDADIFEIIPEDKYTSDDLDYTDENARVFKEHDDESLRNIKLEKDTVDNWEDYDTILIGYPIWWGMASWPVNTFVKANDFNGKTVIPFCTSSSSGLGQSGKLLEEEANGGNWKGGHRFRSNATDEEINDWIDSIK